MRTLALRRNGARNALAVVAALLLFLGVRSAAADAYPAPGYVTGDTIVHDPSIVIRPSDPRYLIYGYGHGGGSLGDSLTSRDRVGFSSGGSVFAANPSWWQWWEPNQATSLWSPDVSYHNGQYWLYYAVSTFGSQYSAIALATSSSGLPGTWTDQGAIFGSDASVNYNAIDPNLVVDANGNWWLTFGSFWGGIFILPLDRATGKPTSYSPVNIAARPIVPDAIEAGFMYRHGGYYYLFASYDLCCKGSASTYNIRVGRSSSPTGPFVGDAGRAMTNGGGKVVLAGHDNVAGPGGESVSYDAADGHDLLVYHYYDKNRNGYPFLGINWLGWDSNGWPYVY